MTIDNISPTMPGGSEDTDVLDDVGVGLAAKVILFDDDIHTFEEVILQLMKATGCSLESAEAMTVEVHTRGKSVVYQGDLPDCLRVSGVLEEIALHTQVEM